jgi:DNA-binding XRE family transcriptional regulator
MEHLDLRYGVKVPNLRVWRQSRFLSQTELAAHVGVSRDTILAAEAGRPIRLVTLGRLAKFFKVSRETLIYDQPPQRPKETGE